MEYILALYATLGFWVVLSLGAVGLLLFVFVENERGVLGLLLITGTLIGLHFLTEIKPFTYVYNNPLNTLLYASGYILIGIIWSMFKWDRYGAKWRRKYDTAKLEYAEYLEHHNRTTSAQGGDTPYAFKTWAPYAVAQKPVASNHKERITTWMTFWPWSFIWTLIADFIKDLYNWIFRKLITIYDKIASRHLVGVED